MSALTLAPILRFVAAEREWPLTAGVERMAKSLPAVACAGFEFALAGEGGSDDLQQRIKTPPEIDRLRHVLSAQPAECDTATRLLPLCDSGLIGKEIDEIWLEVDHDAPANVPSVFGRLSDTLTGARRQDAALRLLAALGLTPHGAQQVTIARCFEACAEPVRISHLGVMLSRAGAPLNLVIEGVALDAAAGFLDALGWPGDSNGAQRRIDRLSAYVDRIRLSVTIGDRIEPALGLECFIGTPDRFDPRWRSVLDQLVAQGLCNPRQRDRMLGWPATITPHSASTAWPDALVVDALVRSPAEIGWLDCRISHVKLSHHDDRLTRAKGYVGVVGVWEQAALVERTDAGAATSHQARSPSNAIEAAIEYLLGARTHTGWWLDYEGFREGISDEWVTAYVACALAEVDAARARGAAQRAWSLLAQRSRAGWGWNTLQPEDADSTTWGLRLAAALGESASARAHAALDLLRRHASADGGIATYLAGAHAAMPNGAVTINPGWYRAHGCVTAAAAALDSIGDAPLDWLRAHQRADGAWDGYWWMDQAYATAHAVDAIAARRLADDTARLEHAVTWARGRLEMAIAEQGPLRSPFATALALCPLLSASPSHAGADRSLIERATDKILACQHDDGSWEGSATLLIPNAAGDQVPAVDRRRTLTTATVLRALVRVTRA